MRANLKLTDGLVMAEALSAALGAELGRARRPGSGRRAAAPPRAWRERAARFAAVAAEAPEILDGPRRGRHRRRARPRRLPGLGRRLRRPRSRRPPRTDRRGADGSLRASTTSSKARPTAPVLVLANSLGSDAGDVGAAGGGAARREFRVVRFDARGHGGSPVPPGPVHARRPRRATCWPCWTASASPALRSAVSRSAASTALWIAANAPERVAAPLRPASPRPTSAPLDPWLAAGRAGPRPGHRRRRRRRPRPLVHARRSTAREPETAGADAGDDRRHAARRLRRLLRGRRSPLTCAADLGQIAAPTLVISGSRGPGLDAGDRTRDRRRHPRRPTSQ